MNDIKQKSKAAFNRQAPTYDKDIRGQHARSLYPVLLKKLSSIPYSSALDLGCGTGEMIQLILKQDVNKKLTGIDLSEKMLEIAKEKLGNKATFILGDSEKLPFSENTFDVVFCNDSFHHYPAPEKVLAEIQRVLKQNGTFVMCDCWQPALGRAIMNFYMRYSKEGDVKIYSKQEICTMFDKFFSNVQWHQVNSDSCIVYGKKFICSVND